MKSKILNILNKKHADTGGHCGIYFPCLRSMVGCSESTLRAELNALFKENLIEVREGIHGKLIRVL